MTRSLTLAGSTAEQLRSGGWACVRHGADFPVWACDEAEAARTLRAWIPTSVPPAAPSSSTRTSEDFATGGVAGSSQRLGSEPTGPTLTASTVTCGQVSESAVNSPPETPGGSDTTPFFDREGGAARRAGVGSARRATETPGVSA